MAEHVFTLLDLGIVLRIVLAFERLNGQQGCEHAFVTAQGSPYPRLRRALDHGNLTEALSAASELQHVGLVEALELCLLLCDRAPEKYGRAALRWHGRYCREVAGRDTRRGPSGTRHACPAAHGSGAGSKRALRSSLPAWARESRGGSERLGFTPNALALGVAGQESPWPQPVEKCDTVFP